MSREEVTNGGGELGEDADVDLPLDAEVEKVAPSGVLDEGVSEATPDQTSVKSQKKRKRRKIEPRNASDDNVDWANSLSECQLDLMLSVKQLAMERVQSTREKSLNGLLTPAGLRAIGIILEEFMLDRVQTLRNAPTTPSPVIDELRACIENSEVETHQTKEMDEYRKGIETDEGS